MIITREEIEAVRYTAFKAGIDISNDLAAAILVEAKHASARHAASQILDRRTGIPTAAPPSPVYAGQAGAAAAAPIVMSEPTRPPTHAAGERFTIKESHFGPYIAPSLPQGCDTIVVFANKHEHVPVWLGLPHQLYVRTAQNLIAKHGGDHLTIVPYRNADKIDIPEAALATTEGK